MGPQRRKRKSSWTGDHVRRLFWRAGFGARPDEVKLWTRRGKAAAINWLVDARGRTRTLGRTPIVDGYRLDPVNEFNHDKLAWLDRMVRTNHPLVEKMTLFWHDHFATRAQPTPLMLAQNETQRRLALGAFPALLEAMTLDAALARSLSLTKSVKGAPNENYARELMELFTLGSGYSETDIREAARALTGLREVRANGQITGVVHDPGNFDAGTKTIFGQAGAFGWQDTLRLCVAHPAHAPFLVSKLWDFFVGQPLDPAVRDKLAAVYVQSGHQLKPVLKRILAHPALYTSLDRPDMVKWPAVLIAGQLRTMRASVDTADWVKVMSEMGQTLFAPPDVSGWDWGARWMSSQAMRARWEVANVLVREGGHAEVRRGSLPRKLRRDQHVALARRAVGDPAVTRETEAALRRLVRSYGSLSRSSRNAEQLQRSLRHLLISGPDNQLC